MISCLKNYFFHLLLAGPGLRRCAGFSLVAAHRLLMAVASILAAHRCCGARASVAAVPRL